MAVVKAATVPGTRVKTRLARSFFARSAELVAPALLGKTLVVVSPSGARLAVRLVETEAYGPGDPASHAFRGPTARTEVMFGPAGHLYVYFVYGMHWCANVVTGASSEGSAVLLRAGEPLEGREEISIHRGGREPLATGPGRLAQALGLTGADSGTDVVGGARCWFEKGTAPRSDAVAAGPRVGVRQAADVPWRFWEIGNSFVSPPRAP
ncbi:MAG: DNA-3-methyladenine glycosylase [Actinomycetota bacterium]